MTGTPDWMADARCTGLTDLFFSEALADVKAAKQTCARCPIRKKCRTEALDNGEKWGVWGGLSAHQLRTITYARLYKCEECGVEFRFIGNRRRLCDDPECRRRRASRKAVQVQRRKREAA